MSPIPFESESELFDRDSLFETPVSRKRGFRRPRKPWNLVKEWALDEYDTAVVYEQIKAIMELSLEDAGSKEFAKPNPNSIAGWRQKQVPTHSRFHSISTSNLLVVIFRTMSSGIPSRAWIHMSVLLSIVAPVLSSTVFTFPIP